MVIICVYASFPGSNASKVCQSWHRTQCIVRRQKFLSFPLLPGQELCLLVLVTATLITIIAIMAAAMHRMTTTKWVLCLEMQIIKAKR